MSSQKEIERLEGINTFYEKGDPMDEKLIDREVHLLERFADRSGKAIEIGVGNGYLTERLVKIYNNLSILEPAQKNIDLMKKRVELSDEKIFKGLLEDFERTEKYDEVLFLNILEHVEDPIESLKKVEGILSDEGTVYISVPNCMSLNRRAGYKMGLLPTYSQLAPKDIEVGHRRLYTVQMLTDHIEKAGMRLEAMKGIYLKPLSEKQMFSLGEEAINAFHLIGEEIPEYCATLFAIAKKRNY
jgi:2-polyprenyl-3-methyl-5-hydroxy-6-metoxy-1,4-benzoquinol methylase